MGIYDALKWGGLGDLFRRYLTGTKALLEVRSALKENLPFTSRIGQRSFGLIGTAIDCRIRFYLQDHSVTELKAFRDVFLRGRNVFDNDFNLGAMHFFEGLHYFLRRTKTKWKRLSRESEIDLNCNCLGLAKFQTICRTGIVDDDTFISSLRKSAPNGDGNSLRRVLAAWPKSMIMDMTRLSQLFFVRCRHWFDHEIELGFDSGYGRWDVLVGDTLYDLKSTKNPIRSIDLFQILSYALQSGHKRTGFYFVRNGVSISWNVRDLFERMKRDDSRINFDSFRKKVKRHLY